VSVVIVRLVVCVKLVKLEVVAVDVSVVRLVDVNVLVVPLVVWDVSVLLVKLEVVAVNVSVVRLVDVNVLVVPLLVWDVSVPDVPVGLKVKVRVVLVVSVVEDKDVCVRLVWLTLLTLEVVAVDVTDVWLDTLVDVDV
jgi:hypothetical protein